MTATIDHILCPSDFSANAHRQSGQDREPGQYRAVRTGSVSVGSPNVRLGACAGEDGFLRMRAATTRVDLPSAVADGAGRVRVECDAPAARLRHLFEVPITRALGERPGRYRVQLREGRGPDELLALVSVAGRRVPLTLFFPDAKALTADDVERIVHSVLEGMGPFFP